MNIIKSFAKLNLYLHVTGKTKNNEYHLLDSLVVFCNDIYDIIKIAPHNMLEINVSGPYARHIENNILARTLDILTPYLKNKNFTISLEKNIPIGAGMGGGSSNAAALIKLLIAQNLLKLDETKIYPLLKEIGSDVPVCFQGKASYLAGVGEEIESINCFPELWAVVLFPEQLTLTSSIFSKGFNKYKIMKPREKNFVHNNLLKYLENTENDLYHNFTEDCPDIKNWLSNIQNQEGCVLSRMTGSGSAIFGLFKTENHAIKAKEELKKKYNFFIEYSGLF